jgi:hypothetical protein
MSSGKPNTRRKESKLRKTVDHVIAVFVEGFVYALTILIAVIGGMMLFLGMIINASNPVLFLVERMFLAVGFLAMLLGVFENIRFLHQRRSMTPDSMLQLAIVLFLLFIVLLSMYFLLPLLPVILHVHASTGVISNG